MGNPPFEPMYLLLKNGGFQTSYVSPGIPTTIKTMGVNITTIAYLRVLIIEMGSTIIFMVVEAPGLVLPEGSDFQSLFLCDFGCLLTSTPPSPINRSGLS